MFAYFKEGCIGLRYFGGGTSDALPMKRDDLPAQKCCLSATLGFRPNSWSHVLSRTTCAAITSVGSVLHKSCQRKKMGEDGHLPNDVRSVLTSVLFT